MVENSRDELYNLSSQMIDVFIKDIFSKNKVDLKKVNISNEQREVLKQSIDELRKRVEDFTNQNASKTVTENTQTNTDISEPVSPLKDLLSKKTTTNDDRLKKYQRND